LPVSSYAYARNARLSDAGASHVDSIHEEDFAVNPVSRLSQSAKNIREF